MSKRDREAEWEQKKAEMGDLRSITDSIEHSFEKNPDRFLAILAEVKKDPEAVKRAKNAGKNLPLTEQEREESFTYAAEPRQESVPSKYAQIVQQLNRFPFSDDPAVLKQQMTVVEGALRTAMQDIIIKAVATNTKKAFKQYCTRIQKVAGGLLVTYNFGKQDIFVTAKGNFFGDETICIMDSEDGLTPSVIRIDGEDATNLSSDFDIKVKE